jgi:hypothetical protein
LPRFVRPARSPTAANRGNRCRWVILQSGSGDRFGLIGEIPPKTIVSDQPQTLYRATAKNEGKRPCGICSKLIAESKLPKICRDEFLIP